VKSRFVDSVAHDHVLRTMDMVRKGSPTLKKLADEGRIAIVGGMYDVASGEIQFFSAAP
jgi:carbonic anhydrase